VCEEAECIEKKYIVFRDSLDLQAHRVKFHKDKKAREVQVCYHLHYMFINPFI
jgi:hypothetical protein